MPIASQSRLNPLRPLQHLRQQDWLALMLFALHAALVSGLGIWATIERASGAPIGLHLINHIRGETDIQVGYLLYPEFWGKGYATEGARAALRSQLADRSAEGQQRIANQVRQDLERA